MDLSIVSSTLMVISVGLLLSAGLITAILIADYQIIKRLDRIIELLGDNKLEK